jgi:hypothetical protein
MPHEALFLKKIRKTDSGFTGKLGPMAPIVPTWDVEPSGCHVCTQQDALLCGAELKEGGGAPLLLLLAVDVLQGVTAKTPQHSNMNNINITHGHRKLWWQSPQ